MTFAGSPDRVEARLVPERGYAFDAVPRRRASRGGPGSRLAARARARGGARRSRAARILARRRPDVVLGGGGYVAGPMVLAAWTRRIPAALTEADAHLGLANRLAAPFARPRLPRVPDRRARRREVPRRRTAGRRAARAPRPRARRARALRAARRTSPSLLVFGGSLGARSAERARRRRVGRRGPAGAAPERRARLRVAARPRARATTTALLAVHRRHRRSRSALPTSRVARAGGSVWELAAAGQPAMLVPSPYATGDHQTKNARYFARAGGARRRRRSATPRARARARRRAARRPGARSTRWRAAMRAPRAARRGRRRSPRSSSRSQPLAGRRLWIAGIGGAGMSALRAARARVGRRGRRLGPRRDAVPRAPRAGIDVDVAPEPPHAAGGLRRRYVSTRVRRARRGPPARRAARRARRAAAARSSSPARTARRRRAAMIAFCLDRLGLDPLPRRRRGAAARRQRARRRRAGSSSRATSPTARSRRSRPEIAVAPERRPRPPHRRSPRSAEVEQLFEEWLAHVPQVVRGEELDAGRRSSSRSPASTTGATPPPRSPRSSSSASPRGDAERVLVEFTRRRPAVRAERRGGRRPRRRRLRAPPGRARARRSPRVPRRTGACSSLFQPHLYSRTRHLAHELRRRARGRRRRRASPTIYPAREEPRAPA